MSTKVGIAEKLASTWDVVSGLWPLKKAEPLTRAHEGNLARQWGRLNFHSVVRYVPKAPVFVHCHKCRWPVSPGRTHMLLGGGQRAEATEEQMQRICEGVRKQMGAA